MNAVGNRSSFVHRLRHQPGSHQALIYKQPIEDLQIPTRHLSYAASPIAYIGQNPAINSRVSSFNTDLSKRPRNVTNIMLGNNSPPVPERLSHYTMFGLNSPSGKMNKLPEPVSLPNGSSNRLIGNSLDVMGQFATHQPRVNKERQPSTKVSARSQQSCCSTETDEESDELIIDVEQVNETQSYEVISEDQRSRMADYEVSSWNQLESLASQSVQQANVAHGCVPKSNESGLLDALSIGAKNSRLSCGTSNSGPGVLMNDQIACAETAGNPVLHKKEPSSVIGCGLDGIQTSRPPQEFLPSSIDCASLIKSRLIYDSVFASFLSQLGGSLESQALMAILLKNNPLVLEQSLSKGGQNKKIMGVDQYQYQHAGSNAVFSEAHASTQSPSTSGHPYRRSAILASDVRASEPNVLINGSHLKSCLSGNSPVSSFTTAIPDNQSPINDRSVKVSRSCSAFGNSSNYRDNPQLSDELTKQTIWQQQNKTSDHEQTIPLVNVLESSKHSQHSDCFRSRGANHKPDAVLSGQSVSVAASSCTDFKNISSLVTPTSTAGGWRDAVTLVPSRNLYTSDWQGVSEVLTDY